MLRLLLVCILPLAACQSTVEKAERALQAGDHDLAEDLLTQAAAESVCPARGEFLVRRAEVQLLQGKEPAALATLDRTIHHCPDVDDAWWMRAQRRKLVGDRAGAIEDARHVQDRIPEAAELVRAIEAELASEDRVRDRASDLVAAVRAAFDPEAPTEVIDEPLPPLLAREVPVPVSMHYAVVQHARRPQKFELRWEETWAYRGDATEDGYVLVRTLDVPVLSQDLPVYYRLLLSKLRLPMRFTVDPQGTITNARFLTNGPNRGLRPELLAPEIEAELKRRRLYEPGRDGRRAPGDQWAGETRRIVDGKPVDVRYDATAVAWERVRGLRTLHVRSQLSGEGFSGDEDLWLHPETAVPVKWIRTSRYTIGTDTSNDAWDETQEADLLTISGGD